MADQNLKFLISADDKASAAFSKVRGELGQMQTSAVKLTSVLAGLGVSLSAGALVGWFKNIASGVDQLNDLKAATGASIGNLSALEDVAMRNGIAIDVAGDAVLKLNKALNTASDPKSDAAAAIRALGLSVDELKKLDPVEALQRIALALNGFADDGNKGRVVLTLLGKSVREVAPLLKEMAEAGTLNAKVTEEQAQQAKAFSDNLAVLHKNSVDLARVWVGQLLPAANQLLEGLKAGGVRGGLDAFGELIGFGKEYYANRNIKILTKDIADLQERLATVAAGTPYAASLQKQIDVKREELKPYLRELEKVAEYNRIIGGIDANQNYGNEGRRQRPSLPATPSGMPDVKKLKDTGLGPSQIPQSLADALKGIDNTDIVKIERLNAEFEQLVNMRASGLGGDAALDERLAKVRDELQKLDPTAQAAEASMKRLQAILQQTPTEKNKQMLSDIEFINAQFAAGKIKSAEEWGEAIRVATGTAENGVEKIGKTSEDVAEQIGLVFSSAAGDAIRNFRSLGDVIRGVGQDLLQILVKTSITDPLSAAVTGGIKNSGGLFAWLGSLLPSFAVGTSYVPNDMVARIHKGERIVPAAQNRAGAAGGLTYAPVINIDSRSDRAQVGALVSAAVAQGQRQMLEHLQAQGVTA